MAIKAVVFDLDGTLLPMDQDRFTKGYFGFLTKKMAAYGYEPQKLIDAIWAGTAAMVKNDGSQSNEAAFWQVFAALYGDSVFKDKPLFDAFYRDEFQDAKAFCGFQPQAAETVKKVRAAGYRVALATNPIFPSIATESRIRWAGLLPEAFEFYTTYENSSHCKPNPAYYTDVAARLGLAPEACLMVGNDATEDLIAEKVGMQVFLLTDCLINREQKDLSLYPQGGFDRLLERLGIRA